MFDDLVVQLPPPPKRIGFCVGAELEHHLPEGAVSVAFALHLLKTVPGLARVSIHPDGEHGKRFAFRVWLEKRGFRMVARMGRTDYGGTYESRSGHTIVVSPSSRHGGDVIAETDTTRLVAECKGGIINTKHAGQSSRLRRGLCEMMGQSLSRQLDPNTRQFAVAPRTRETEALARKLAPRAHMAGIEIALVDGSGNVMDVSPDRPLNA